LGELIKRRVMSGDRNKKITANLRRDKDFCRIKSMEQGKKKKN